MHLSRSSLQHLPTLVRRLVWLAPLSLALLLSACGTTVTVAAKSGTPGATSAGGTPAPTATPAPAAPPPHAFAWYQYDGSHAPQIWASVNGASPVQVTHLAPPPANGCDNEIAWSPPVFSPDLTHIAAAMGGYGCGDGGLSGQLNIIDASSGALTPVPNSGIRLIQREVGWLNNSTIWFANYAGVYTYSLGAASATPLPGPQHVAEAVLRGSTLFWEQELTYAYTLHRYDMGAHTALPGTINLGSIHMCQCSPGDYHTPGWDVSPDGAHVAYQVVSPGPGPDFGISSSAVYYANADGSGASQIAHYMTTNTLVRMQIAPNGQLVAFTNALPSPSVITASVSSPGFNGDPNFHSYTPDAVDFPVWKWDSSQLWAATKEAGSDTSNLQNYTVGGGSVVGVAGGFNPWYTIGG